MKRSAVRILAVVIALSISVFGHSSATEGARALVMALQEGEGITQALERNGCSMNWLTEAIRLSGISSVQNMRLLPLGAEITVPLPCDKEPAPAVARESRLIMARDRYSTLSANTAYIAGLTEELEGERRRFALSEARAQELEGEIASLRTKLKEAEAAQRDAVALKGAAVADREERLASLQAELSRLTALRRGNLLWFAGGGALIVLLVGAGMFAFGKHRGENGRKNEVLLKGPRNIEVLFNGTKYVFEFDTFSRKDSVGEPEMHYRCPLCKERMLLAHNPERHLRGVHRELSDIGEKTNVRPIAVT